MWTKKWSFEFERKLPHITYIIQLKLDPTMFDAHLKLVKLKRKTKQTNKQKQHNKHLTNWWTTTTTFPCVYFREFSFNRPNFRCVCMQMCCGCVCEWVFFSLGSWAIIGGWPKCSHSFVYILLYAMVCAFYFSLCPSLCRWRVRASCYGKSNFLCISRSHFHCQNLQYNCIVPAAAIWIHGFSLSLLLFISTFLVRSSWTPVTFANLRIFFFLSLRCIRFCLHLVSLYSFVGRTVFRALCLWPCTHAHTHAEKSAHDHCQNKKKRELFLQMRKSHTHTHKQTHASRLRIPAATRIRLRKHISKWACEQDAKSKAIMTQTEIANFIDGFGQCMGIARFYSTTFIVCTALCVDVIFWHLMCRKSERF